MKKPAFIWPRWAVVIPLVLLLAYVTEGGCNRQVQALTAVMVAAPLLSLWATHAAMLTGRMERRWWRFPLFFLHDLAFTLLLAAIPLALLSTECNGTRGRVGETLATMVDMQREIATTLARGKPVTPRDDFSPADIPGAAYLRVSPDGTILMITRKPVAFVQMQLKVNGKNAGWHCLGYPGELMPGRCGSLP